MTARRARRLTAQRKRAHIITVLRRALLPAITRVAAKTMIAQPPNAGTEPLAKTKARPLKHALLITIVTAKATFQ